MYKIALVFYYVIIAKLPNSRYISSINKIRVWYLAKILRIIDNSDSCIFEDGVYISSGKDRVKIGHHSHVNQNTFIQGAQIGNYVMIGPDVSLLSNSHNFDRIDVPMERQGMTDNNPVVIEDDVWIGRNVVILPGITIHKGSIVGAGAVVTKDVEPYSIVGGVPAKFIKKRI